MPVDMTISDDIAALRKKVIDCANEHSKGDNINRAQEILAQANTLKNMEAQFKIYEKDFIKK